MGKFEDMTLLVEVVEAGGLAAAGRWKNVIKPGCLIVQPGLSH